MKKPILFLGLMLLMTAVAFGQVYNLTEGDTEYWSGNFDCSATCQYVVAPVDGEAWVSDDYGATWSSTVLEPTGYMDNFAISDNGQYIVGGNNADNGQLYISNDYGSSWTNATVTARWWDCGISGDGSVMICGVEVSGSPNPPDSIYYSTDYGTTWTQTNSTLCNRVYMIDVDYDGNVAVATCNGDNVFTSSDGGATWTNQTTSGVRSWYAISVNSDGTKMVAGTEDISGDYVYKSTDSGLTWTALTSSPLKRWMYARISDNGQIIVAVAMGSVSIDGGLYVSQDAGQTFVDDTPANLTYNGQWYGVAMSNSGDRIVAGDFDSPVYYGYLIPPEEWTPQHEISDVTGLVIDFGVEFGIQAIALAGIIALVGIAVWIRGRLK